MDTICETLRAASQRFQDKAHETMDREDASLDQLVVGARLDGIGLGLRLALDILTQHVTEG